MHQVPRDSREGLPPSGVSVIAAFGALLRELIADREEDFARGFTKHLIEYALGRTFSFSDEDLADAIVQSAGREAFALSEFIHALVQSKPFRSK